MLGMSKDFVFMLFVAVVFWIGTNDVFVALQVMFFYIAIKIVWRFLR